MLTLAITCIASNARAGMWYYDLGGGITRLNDPNTTGFAFDNAVYAGLGKNGAPVELQIGLQDRYSSASGSNGLNYTYQALYPAARLQFDVLYFGGGVTPLLWRRASTSSGLSGFTYASGALGYFGEAGLLWSLTPTFTVGLNAALQSSSGGTQSSPKSAVDGTISFRFYFSVFSKDKQSSGEYEGWRYPFGFFR
jgi:hypothetical protein